VKWSWLFQKEKLEVEIHASREKEEIERRLAYIHAQVGVLSARAELTERRGRVSS
jgi:hypothetical protein